MSDFALEVMRLIQQRRLFAPGEKILLAVSGGVDSMVLLHVLAVLSRENGWKLGVGHLNHCLRGRSSDRDERLVATKARELGLRCVVERADVKSHAKAQNISVEMAARRLRHDFLVRAAKRLRCQRIALAHHADDQVESFFIRLLRGASLEGMAGMKWMSPSPANAAIGLARRGSRQDAGDPIILVRPFLSLTREQIETYAAANGIAFRHDATNDQTDILRNRVRHELIPLLQNRYQPAIRQVVLRLMDIARAESEVVSQALDRWSGAFEGAPVAMQRRLLRRELAKRGIVADYDLIERLREHADTPIAVSEGLMVVRDADGAVRRYEPEGGIFNGEAKILDLEVAAHATFDGVRFSWSIQRLRKEVATIPRKSGTEMFDADKVGSRIVMRHWQPGDRFQPIGMAGSTKLQDFFANQKVPRGGRHTLALATTEAGEVFWVEGMRISERFKLDATTKRRLEWSWRRSSRELRRGSKDANLERKSRH